MRIWSIFTTICLLVSLCCACSAQQDPSALQAIRFNEVQTSGNNGDWIELYNTSSDDISLAGCYLTDDPNEPGKWQFPAITIQGSEYFVLYADNNTDANDGLTHLPFRLSADGASLRLSTHSGSVLQEIEIPASASGLSYGCDEESSAPNSTYVWYASPTPGKPNTTGMLLGKENTVAEFGVRINEYMSRNRSVFYDENGDYSDWIELHNFTDHDIDISGFTLTDSRSREDKWSFPTGTVLSAKGYLVVRCSGRNVLTSGGELHTNFKLSDSDSFVGLYTAEGHFCSGINFADTPQNFSRVYTENGYAVCRYPTPGYVNSNSITEVTE